MYFYIFQVVYSSTKIMKRIHAAIFARTPRLVSSLIWNPKCIEKCAEFSEVKKRTVRSRSYSQNDGKNRKSREELRNVIYYSSQSYLAPLFHTSVQENLFKTKFKLTRSYSLTFSFFTPDRKYFVVTALFTRNRHLNWAEDHGNAYWACLAQVCVEQQLYYTLFQISWPVKISVHFRIRQSDSLNAD